jgi:hypothetical protein
MARNPSQSLACLSGRVECGIDVVHIARVKRQRFLTDFRDEIRAVAKGVNIAGMDNTDRVPRGRAIVDELFSLMKPPSID